MNEWFASLKALEVIYVLSALVGGTLFVIRLVTFVVGMGADGDMDGGHGDIHADGDVHADGDAHMDSDAGFKVLTLQGITAFLMIFGLIGLGVYQAGWMGKFLSVPVGAAAGALAMFSIGKMFQFLLRFQSEGTVQSNDAVGAEGMVYLTIHKNSPGKVQIKIADRLREYEATSDKGEEIKTGEAVLVVGVKSNVLIVQKL